MNNFFTKTDLSRKDAVQLLNNVQNNHATGYAIQGKKDCRYVSTDTVTATVKPQEGDFGELDYSKNTFEIYSNYWGKSTLQDFIEK